TRGGVARTPSGPKPPLQTLSKIFPHACHCEERFATSRVVQEPPARDPPKARPEENLYHPGWRPRSPQKSGAAYLFSCPQSHMRHVTCARTAFVMPRERAVA